MSEVPLALDDRDLMRQEEIREVVDRAYSTIANGAGLRMVKRLYDPEQIDLLPNGAIEWALGVGNPVRHAGLCAGETVLDVGCGGGIDSILAAALVGPDGRVMGLDSLDVMLERARGHAEAAGVGARCELLAGTMEAIPLPDNSVDIAISNGVVNLSPRKTRVLAELWRVLKPGGRLCLVDFVVDDLPPEVLTSDAAWAG
ncbi:MAG TPA: methyltransferase domain-containing protein [Chloroflexota bacterium]|jgi:SAM-dependent methyltransferase